MEKFELYQLAEKYFDFSSQEVESFLTKKFNKKGSQNQKDLERLYEMLKAVCPFLDKFLNKETNVEKIDSKLKRKVGLVFFSKLDYSSFDPVEIPRYTYFRLKNLFEEIYNKGINPYKVVYCTVLTDGNIKKDFGKKNNNFVLSYDSAYSYLGDNSIYEAYRNFTKIYDTVSSTLSLSQNETNDLFEKCSSLISKGNTFRIPQVYNTLKNLKIAEGENCYSLFVVNSNNNEVVDLLKRNPSLLNVNSDKIGEAYRYIIKSLNFTSKEKSDTLSPIESKLIAIRKLFKNNSSLFMLNVDEMKKKQYFLTSSLNQLTDFKYSEGLKNLFSKPINLAIVNKLNYSNLIENATKNIYSFENIISYAQCFEDEKKQIAYYIEDNPYFLSMQNNEVEKLFEAIYEADKKQENHVLLQKFVKYGKTLFASNADFNFEKIMEKLNTELISEIDLENMDMTECLYTFVELFMNDDYFIINNYFNAMEAREYRDLDGESELRHDIRTTGREIADLPKILKSDLSNKQKSTHILKLADKVGKLQYKRLSLADEYNWSATKIKEVETSLQIEGIINRLREAYESKKFHVGKYYSNSDLLFEKLMDFVSDCFDDKEAISELFNKEIHIPFAEALKETYVFDEKPKSLFNESLEIVVNSQQIGKALKTLTKAVELSSDVSTTDIDIKTDITK